MKNQVQLDTSDVLEVEENQEDRSARGASVPGAGATTLVLTHGTYVGPGCPDANKRKQSKDIGFNYDHDHVAVVGERVQGLTAHEAERMIRSKCFKHLAQAKADVLED